SPCGNHQAELRRTEAAKIEPVDAISRNLDVNHAAEQQVGRQYEAGGVERHIGRQAQANQYERGRDQINRMVDQKSIAWPFRGTKPSQRSVKGVAEPVQKQTEQRQREKC